MQQLMKTLFAGTLVPLLLLTAGVQADVSKASDWLGRSVVTQAGEPLGRIEDMAVDIESARIVYLVVSVGSFLIDDALIAVHPDALGASADGRHLVLNSTELKSARRFNADSWPSRPDVLAAATSKAAPVVDDEATPADRVPEQGRAFISDGRRQGVVEGGERRIGPVQRSTGRPLSPDAAQTQQSAVDPEAIAAIDAGRKALPPFSRIDSNGDARLDRNEFGPYLGLKETYGNIDADGSGYLDEFEYELLKERRGGR